MSEGLLDRVIAAVGDQYEVEAEIGRGGMAVVYRARDKRLRRHVAIKVLPPELAFREDVRSRFLREAQMAAQLSHPNIVQIYSVDERGGMVYFVMALVTGESVAARLSREARPPMDFVVRVLTEVADALHYAHERGIIHRDIKPDNILIDTATGRPMVTDFGIARAAEGDARLTVTGVAVGTPAYMSPEQAVGARELDGRTDVYSLGVVGYQMLCGEPPFSAANTPAMLMKHISETPRPIADVRGDVPTHVVAAIARALEKNPDRRFPDAGRFRDALRSGSPEAPVAGRRGVDESQRRHSLSTGRAGELVARPATDRVAQPARDAREGAHNAAPDAPREEAPRDRDDVRALKPWEMPRVNGVPPVPSWMPPSWREARKDWTKEARDEARAPGEHADWRTRHAERRDPRDERRLARQDARDARRAAKHESLEAFSERPIEDRIRIFRRKVIGNGSWIAVLATMNMVWSPDFWWFLFPTAFMTAGLLQRGAVLWADGARFRDLFGRRPPLPLPARDQVDRSPSPSRADEVRKLASPEVLDGPHGEAVRHAVESRATIREAIGKLAKPDRELIPDVLPTVDMLVDRVAALANALHRIDADVDPRAIADLDRRILACEAESSTTPNHEHRLALLHRQRSTLDDLLKRRASLAARMESASLMLENIKLDLVTLRSAGVQSSIDDVSTATQEARALSREIGHVLEAAKQIRGV